MKKISLLNEHIWQMQNAIKLARDAYKADEVPVGAMVVDERGKIISSAHNLKEKTNDPCGHAEVLAIREAASLLNRWRLSDCYLYVTLEPCVMCMGALIQARIKGLIFGAYDAKAGSISTGHYLHRHPKLNHHFSVIGGVEHYQCSTILSQFFREKRLNYKQLKQT